jgi:NDP-sugar pyrophosphorylase family protein
MKAVIMAGGLGQRLMPFTKVIPKPLLPLGEKSILEITIHNLIRHGATDIYLTLNHMSEYFDAYFNSKPISGAKLHFSVETTKLGTAGPLKLLENELDCPFLLINGDILTNLNFSQFYKEFTDSDYELMVGTKHVLLPTDYGVVTANGDEIINLEEKPNIETEVVAGIYCISPKALSRVPADKEYNMNELLHDMLNRKKLGRFVIQDYWLDIGRMENYSKAQEDIKELTFV